MSFFKNKWTALLVLSMFFINVSVSFAVIYMVLEVTELGHVIDHYEQHKDLTIITFVWKSIYFSVITMAAVGYGDITPVGYSQLVATIQSVIGYLFPIMLVFVLSSSEKA
ncbi:ion channel [Alteribacillus bidgolensis]|uniref:Ion channel n=1 Tax=Alteribacillus bidgolensis TaxID=930129 RepID=A0A1G8IM40_9BACI|nr:ion channel [Alteribacillus bidgolensis]SDI19580.1 Ion channel [Alteribacillus bidgolensis]